MTVKDCKNLRHPEKSKAFIRLARYEAIIHRRLRSAVTELRRLKQEPAAIMAELRQMSRPVPKVKAQNEATLQRAASTPSPTAATFPCIAAGRQSSVPNSPTKPDLSNLRLGSPSDTKARNEPMGSSQAATENGPVSRHQPPAQNEPIAPSPPARTAPGAAPASLQLVSAPLPGTGIPGNLKAPNKAIASSLWCKDLC